MNLLETKPYVELLAYLAAGIFFLYKLVAGYLMTNLSVSIVCSRQCARRNEKDHLAVSVTLSKGNRGSLKLHDVQVRVKYRDAETIKPLLGFERRGTKTEMMGDFRRRTVDWRERNIKQPLLRLTADDNCQFAVYFEVPCAEVCEVELSVIGIKQSGWLPAQWRASAVSLPHVEAEAKTQT